MSQIMIWIVADDFSGASDAASFLVNEGINAFLYNGIPETGIPNQSDPIAVVIALKTRTQETKAAVQESLVAFDWLKKNGAKQLYVKYCSTFDSTKEGNIGPIIDSVLDAYNINYTILAPALPVNDRVVKNGELIVNGVPLHETHMRFHPLTPMWDSDLSKLMEPQGKYPSLKLNYELLEQSNEEILEVIEGFGKDKEHFYIIPDYIEEKHAKKIVELFGELPLLTGGSGLMSELGIKYRKDIQMEADQPLSSTTGRAIILAGSCSAATLEQIDTFKKNNGQSIKVDPQKLLAGTQTKEELWNSVQSFDEDAVLVYSSDKPENVKEVQKAGKNVVSDLLEQTMAYLAKKSVENGLNRVIVAGGETSGAVTRSLGYHAYQVGESIAPGVPVMMPLKNKEIRLILKSGNFGQKEFFTKAVELTKG